MLRTVFFLATFIPLTILVILTGLPASLLSPNYLHNCGRFWGWAGLRLAGVRITVSGQEHLPRTGATIFMPNHQSQFDILALFAGIPNQFRWLAKAELFRIPLFGLAMRRAGYIPVTRDDRRKSLLSMQEAARRIIGGTSVIVFPEGTRSPDGHLLPFKKGGFMLALQSQVPIVPVAIHGSNRILPKHSFWLQGGAIRIEILPSFPTAGLSPADREPLIAAVRSSLAEALGEVPEPAREDQ